MILVLFSPVYLMFALLFRDDRARLVVALYQQVLVLQRQLGKRPSLAKGERLALVLSGLLLARKRLGEALPEYPCHGEIVSRPVLGGLINDYYRLAA